MEYSNIYFTLACVFGFFMAWGVGANDVANAMATSVGSKALSIKQAILIAAIFEFLGAMLAGGQVSHTIRGKIISTSVLNDHPHLLIIGMLSALLAAGCWLLIASWRGWPVSTTHSIIAAIVGFALVAFGPSAIHWQVITGIVLSWIITPIISGIIAFLFFRSIQASIFKQKNPTQQAKIFLPLYIFAVAMILSFITLVKGLKHLGYNFTISNSFWLAGLIATLAMLLGIALLHYPRMAKDFSHKTHIHNKVEQYFGILMIFTACAMAFAHGSNDVANAIGPLAAIIEALNNSSNINTVTTIPTWVLLLGAIGIVLGLSTYGYRVIATIGEEITELTPSRGFCAEIATATTVVIASGTGLPISTTQTLVGAVLGVGLARSISALKLDVIRNIFMSWAITLPAGASLAILFFYCFKTIFQ